MNHLQVAREFTFQFLFHFQLAHSEENRTELKSLDRIGLLNKINEVKETTGHILNDQGNAFVELHIQETLENYNEAADTVRKHLKNWKLERLSKVDHTLLILAIIEMYYTKKAPAAVIINESIELAKKYGSKESPAFINGVLDSASKEI